VGIDDKSGSVNLVWIELWGHDLLLFLPAQSYSSGSHEGANPKGKCHV
jgi:hypothetical protein